MKVTVNASKKKVEILQQKTSTRTGLFAQPHEPCSYYGIRKWMADKGVYFYYVFEFKKGKGHLPTWKPGSDRAWSTNDLLSAIFTAQGLAAKETSGVDVIAFEEKRLLCLHHSNFALSLDNKKRVSSLPKDEWVYSPYRAMLRRNGKPFAIVSPDGRNALSGESLEILLGALGAKTDGSSPTTWKKR